ncbi:MAG: winged helix-turn-helix domain-containing protein [Candidatus Anstonellaceae archaeon]
MKSLFVKLKPANMLLLLKDSSQQWFPSKLARGANCSYVYTVAILNKLQKFGIISFEKKGKQKIYRLTEKGAQIASILDDFIKRCDSAVLESKQQPQQEQKPSEKK